jgi:hypothetical protein
MGFSLTSPAPEKSDPTAKNRVWGFFGETPQSHRENRPQPKQPRQGDPSSLTKTVSGRTYWPSRDPIGERGGINLYGMVENDVVGRFDPLGLKSWTSSIKDFTSATDGKPGFDVVLDHKIDLGKGRGVAVQIVSINMSWTCSDGSEGVTTHYGPMQWKRDVQLVSSGKLQNSDNWGVDVPKCESGELCSLNVIFSANGGVTTMDNALREFLCSDENNDGRIEQRPGYNECQNNEWIPKFDGLKARNEINTYVEPKMHARLFVSWVKPSAENPVPTNERYFFIDKNSNTEIDSRKMNNKQ